MILQEVDIKDIINRPPNKININGQEVLQHNYKESELLNLIQTFIFHVKGIDCKEISPCKGVICQSYMKFLQNNGVNLMIFMSQGSDYNALDFASHYAIKYFINKYSDN